MIIYVDIDGVLCNNTYGNYTEAIPNEANIKAVNKLFSDGHEIILWTARGTVLSERLEEIKKTTLNQLKTWGVQYTRLEFGKPYYDMLIDDRAVKI